MKKNRAGPGMEPISVTGWWKKGGEKTRNCQAGEGIGQFVSPFEPSGKVTPKWDETYKRNIMEEGSGVGEEGLQV